MFERTFARCMGLGHRGDRRHALAGDALPALALRERRRPGRRPGRLRRGVRRRTPPDHRRRRRPRHRVRRRRPAGLRQHAVLLPRHGRATAQLHAAVAAAVRQRSPPRTAATSTAWRCEDGARPTSPRRRSDVADGWRERRARRRHRHRRRDRRDRLLRGLSMPHSPRLHDGRLWLLNSGTGELGRVDRRRALRAGRVLPGLSPAASPSSAITRSSACRSRARTAPSRPGARAALARTRRRAALRAAGDRPQSGDTVELAAHRGRGARALRRRGAARRPQPGRDRLPHRRDPARDLDRRPCSINERPSL